MRHTYSFNKVSVRCNVKPRWNKVTIALLKITTNLKPTIESQHKMKSFQNYVYNKSQNTTFSLNNIQPCFGHSLPFSLLVHNQLRQAMNNTFFVSLYFSSLYLGVS